MIRPSLRLIYDAGEGGSTYVNVAYLRGDVPFPQAMKEALNETTTGMLRNLAFDLIPADDSYEKKLREKFDEIGRVVR